MAKGRGGFIGQDGLNAPDSPTGVSGTAGNQQVTVSWTNPTDVGGSAITGYVISSTPSVPISPPSLTNASYTSKSFSLASQGSGDIHYGMTFNSDGTKAYFTGYGAASIFQYSLSTAWDISTTSYDNVTLSTSGQTSSGQSGLVFSPDGTKLYMVSYNTDTVYQYALTTPYDLSSGSYASKSLSVSSQDSNPQDMYIKSDGTKLYVLGDTNNSVFQYSMSTPFDLATASYDSVSFATTSQQTNPTGLFFSPDGTTMLICGYAPKSADKYTLSTPWVVSSASHVKSYTLTELSSGYPNSIFAGNDLSNMFVAGGNASNTDGSVFQYSVGMPTGSPFVYKGLSNGTSYTFNVWAINAFGYSASSDASTGVTPAVPVLALRFGGNNSSNTPVNTIDKTDITTLGNAVDFGDMNVTSSQNNAAVGSSTRAVVANAFKNDSEVVNELSYKAFSSSGDTTDFGDLTRTFTQGSAASNATRGIFFGGDSSLVMDYITIGSTGNATDFGDMTGSGEAKGHCSCASPTRAVFFGGDKGNNSTNVIGYVTIGSTGNENDFGDLLAITQRASGFSSETRGVCGGGFSGYSGLQNVIQYITIASTGNATDFGDLTTTRKFQSAACSNTRGLFMGGEKSGESYSNDIDYITIASTGDAADFGDLTESITSNIGACSNAHGGLQ